MITNITGTQIIKDITNKILSDDNVDFESKIDITEMSAIYEHNLIRGRREIIHLEAFVNGVMYTLAKANNYKPGKNVKLISYD